MFEPRLNFRFEVESSDSRRYGIRNVAPRAGEQPFYWTLAEESRNGRSYARIALTSNLSGTGKILMLAGQHVESWEGAENASLAPDFRTAMDSVLAHRNLRDVSTLELLLEIICVDGVVHQTKILTYRVS